MEASTAKTLSQNNLSKLKQEQSEGIMEDTDSNSSVSKITRTIVEDILPFLATTVVSSAFASFIITAFAAFLL